MTNEIPAVTTQETHTPGKQYRSSLIMLTSLFFMWGLMTSLNDILIPHLRNAFSLNYTQAMLVQFCFFGAYFLVSLPAGKLIDKIGYKYGIVTGLSVAGIGCLLFFPAAELLSYPVFLGAFFVLAAGITVLQVSANPYVSALGDPATASSRLTMTQAFNSFGTTVGPYLGGLLILGAVVAEVSDVNGGFSQAQQAKSVQIPYVVLGLIFFVVAIVFTRIVLPKLDIEQPSNSVSEGKSAWSYPHLVLGAIGIFVYVGAEVSIGSFLINFLGQENIAGMSEVDASKYVAYFWGGAMVGRFIGAVIMQRVPPGLLLAFNATLAVILVLVAILFDGRLAMWALILTGLFNSIMFPTIFSLGVGGLKQSTSQGSGILCVFIVGGAIVPVAQGMIADTVSIQASFWLPVLCYVYIVFYGLKGCKIGGYN